MKLLFKQDLEGKRLLIKKLPKGHKLIAAKVHFHWDLNLTTNDKGIEKVKIKVPFIELRMITNDGQKDHQWKYGGEFFRHKIRKVDYKYPNEFTFNYCQVELDSRMITFKI